MNTQLDMGRAWESVEAAMNGLSPEQWESVEYEIEQVRELMGKVGKVLSRLADDDDDDDNDD